MDAGTQLTLTEAGSDKVRPGTEKPHEGTAGAGENGLDALGVARVVLDVPLAHLDRPFDYAVPPQMGEAAKPGTRVVVRFAGRDVGGFVIERVESSEHDGALTPLRRVVSPVPVLTPEIRELARKVADRYAGTLSDVLRLAVPPRHARTEAAVVDAVGAGAPTPREPQDVTSWSDRWADYRGGPALIRRLAAGESPRAVWSALPASATASGWREAVSAAVAASLASGRGAVVVAPDVRDVARLAQAFQADGLSFVRLVAEDGPAARYRAFLRALLGEVPVVIGTRAAAFAPVRNLGLVVCWDDGDDLFAEPRAPYPRTLVALTLRADHEGAAALFGGVARSTPAQQLVQDGWARSVHAPRPVVRARTPRVAAPDESDLAREGPSGAGRLPLAALELARAGIRTGPVLVQVPRAGYVPVTACARCRTPARCPHCRGGLRIDSPHAVPGCSWCGRPAAGWRCPVCSGVRFRAMRVGSTRTAEELGRALPGVPVVVSGSSAAGGVVSGVDAAARLVVATPGAEPEAAGGYAAALLLDAALSTHRPELRAAEEALRRWFNAAALVRPAGEGGRVMILGAGAPIPVQALVRWDPAGFAERELAERVDLGLPPASAMAAVEGTAEAVEAFLGILELPGGADALGPVPVPAPGGGDGAPVVRALLRTDRSRAGELSRALARANAVRTARKMPGSVRVRVDPDELW